MYFLFDFFFLKTCYKTYFFCIFAPEKITHRERKRLLVIRKNSANDVSFFNTKLLNISHPYFLPKEDGFYLMSKKNRKIMLQEKAGEVAGKIWNALNETEGLTQKQVKKATKLVDKDFFLGLGWLLREDKVAVSEVENELFVVLK